MMSVIYLVKGWMWHVKNFEDKLSLWLHRWLSSGNRLILAQEVLQNIVVYWLHLFSLPHIIVKKINTIISNFLWAGFRGKQKLHLARLDEISQRKEGGMGFEATRQIWLVIINKKSMACHFLEGNLETNLIWEVLKTSGSNIMDPSRRPDPK